MKRLRAFFHRIALALTKPSAYAELLSRRTGQGIAYLYGVLVLTSLVGGIVIAAGLLAAQPFVAKGAMELKAAAPGLYPAGLVVTLKNGTLSTNASGATVIPFPEHWKTALARSGSTKYVPRNLVVIDTSATAEDYRQKDTAVLITAHSAVYPGKSNGNTGTGGMADYRNTLTVQSFADMQDRVITRATYDGLLAKATPFIDALPALITTVVVLLIVVVPFVYAGFRLLWVLAYLLLATLAVWLIATLLGKKLTYGQLYRLSLYGVTLPILVTLVVPFIGFAIPLLFSLIFLGWMGVVLAKLPKKLPTA